MKAFLGNLIALCGEDRVVRDEADLQFVSEDLFFAGRVPMAIVSPISTAELSAIVKLCRKHKISLFARGGGMSYSQAFQPTQELAITLDFSRLNAIRAISIKDGYVTVEAGCTWAKLDEQLRRHNRRARFWGPMSGGSATVGGSMSQGAVTFGSGTTGASANAVKSFEIVTGTGEIIHSGSDGSENTGPSNRNFGPDLTGIFANDAGALGIKTATTLEIEPRPQRITGLSFAFEDFAEVARVLNDVLHQRLASEIFASDRDVASQNAGRPDLLKDLQAMWAVGRSARNPILALAWMGKIALGGRRFLNHGRYTAHFVIEGRDGKEIASRQKAIRRIARSGREIVNTVPLVTRANPFPAAAVTHPDGRRMLPMHGIFSASQLNPFYADYLALKAGFCERLDSAGVTVAEFFAGIAGIGVLYEPVFYWRDALTEYHRRLTPDYPHSKTSEFPDNPVARNLITAFTKAFVELVHKHGGTHFQLGRLYPYVVNREPGAGALLRTIKQWLDPDNIINPGALGL